MKSKKDMNAKAANLLGDLKEKAFPTHAHEYFNVYPGAGKNMCACGKYQPTHTPTPWTLGNGTVKDKDGDEICYVDAYRENHKADATFIVRAVNAHEANEELMRHVSSELRNLAVRSGRGEIQNQLHVLAEDLWNATITKTEAK